MYNPTRSDGEESYIQSYFESIYEDNLEQLFETINLKKESKKELSEEELRILIFREALIEKRGEKWVSSKLKEKKLRALYLRNPSELVLYYCFLCNDTPRASRTYDYSEFKRLLKILPKIAPPDMGITTFGDLHDYISNPYSSPEQNDDRHTLGTMTLEFENAVNNLDKSSPSAEKRLINIYHEHFLYMVNVSGSIRYYISKYIYYVICAQIFELKELLSFFSNHSSENALKNLGTYGTWTLAGDITSSPEVFNGKQPAKALLQALAQSFVLYGKPENDINAVNPLFVHTATNRSKKVQPGTRSIISFSLLRDQTPIFDETVNSANRRLHDEIKKGIDDLGLKDFYDFKINYFRLYTLLIERVLGEKTYSELNPYKKIPSDIKDIETKAHNLKRNYFQSILSGTADVSRSALLVILAGAKAVIESTDSLLKGRNKIPEKDILRLKRINSILKRVGYVALSDDEEEFSYDEIYMPFFDAYVEEEDNISYIEDLPIAIDNFINKHDQSIIPFEITAISSLAAHNKLMKGHV